MDTSRNRYKDMQYRRAGRSGIELPVLALGLWHNFGGSSYSDTARAIAVHAFDSGICYFDLANEYGPPPGSAEKTFGKILKSDLGIFRDELFIATKAGFRMWPGPYGDYGSRKYLIASLDQSLKRMGLEYVDVFYHHRPDPKTPLEETLAALDHIVRSGKALYIGLSNYNAGQTKKALKILDRLGTPCLLHQPQYSMFARKPERKLLPLLADTGVGCAVYSPLAQGLLTGKYLDDIPKDSRAADPDGYLSVDDVVERREIIRRLNEVAAARNQTLAQMALTWVLRRPEVTSAIIGVSRVDQLEDDLEVVTAPPFTDDDLRNLDQILGSKG